jgi:hypothetical protein
MAAPPYRKWTKEDDDRLLKMLAEGKRAGEIKAELGRSKSALQQRIVILQQREK